MHATHTHAHTHALTHTHTHTKSCSIYVIVADTHKSSTDLVALWKDICHGSSRHRGQSLHSLAESYSDFNIGTLATLPDVIVLGIALVGMMLVSESESE